VFAEPLPSNDRRGGGQTGLLCLHYSGFQAVGGYADTYAHRQQGDLISLLSFSKLGKQAKNSALCPQNAFMRSA
jgi:hypothetical protein